VRVAFGTDESTATSLAARRWLERNGHEVVEPLSGVEWPEVGRAVAEVVAADGAELGVVCCWTGTGVSIAANKVTGVRAALCADAETARGARRWNDANVVALSLRLTSPAVAEEVLEAFCSTPVDPGESAAIERVERGPRKAEES
jgi:ribose 5-phosphate isomerase B